MAELLAVSGFSAGYGRAVVLSDIAFRLAEGEALGACYTRTGRRFFDDDALDRALLERVSAALGGQREHLRARVVRLVAEAASRRAGEIHVLVHVVGNSAVQQSAHCLRDLGNALDRTYVIVGRQDP